MFTRTTNVIDLMPKAKNFAETYRNERIERLQRKNQIIPYGVSFLDDCFHGISPDDLIVFGAKTGAGKTQLALQIAINAAKLGKKVLFFALESTYFELARRLKFGALFEHLSRKYSYANIGFAEWANGIIVEDEDVEPEPWMENVVLVFRLEHFNVTELEKHIRAGKFVTDLIILDHLHYLDLPGDNENTELRDAIKAIRSIQLEIEKPFVMVSHLRKSTRFDLPWPTLEDFHGTSEISKIATQAFSLAQLEIFDSCGRPGIHSVFTVLKNRTDSSRVGKKAGLIFDHARRNYYPSYVMLDYDSKDRKLFEAKTTYPWARHMRGL